MQKNTGFTLVELIVVMVIIGLVAAMGGLILNRVFQGANKFNATNDPNYWQGMIAFERMSRDLRAMVTLVTAGSNSITYVDSLANTVTYSLSPTGSSTTPKTYSLLRSVAPTAASAGNILSTSLTALSFAYYNSSGTLASSVSTVQCINVVASFAQPGQTANTLRTLICPYFLRPEGSFVTHPLQKDIIFSTLSGKAGNVGLILLNRPQVLNALNLEMLQALDHQLAKWAVDDSIKVVIIRGAGERAFCAGGDLRYIYHLPEHLADNPEHNIFWAEYRINQKIFHFPKPYIALMHGITMGGGVGLSVYASHRIAAPDLSFAMPETKIGFYPDVGASYFLPRCPAHVGIYLGLTGESVNARDAEQLGLIDYVVPNEQFDEIIKNIVACIWKEKNQDAHAQVSEIIAKFCGDKIKMPPSNLDPYRIFIDRCFAKDSIEEIFDALLFEKNFWCDKVFAHLRRLSPSSLKVTLAHFREHARLSFDECMKINYRLTLRFIEALDFKEGVRAAIIQKDKKPQWQPNKLIDVNDNLLKFYVQPLGKSQRELSFT